MFERRLVPILASVALSSGCSGGVIADGPSMVIAHPSAAPAAPVASSSAAPASACPPGMVAVPAEEVAIHSDWWKLHTDAFCIDRDPATNASGTGALGSFCASRGLAVASTIDWYAAAAAGVFDIAQHDGDLRCAAPSSVKVAAMTFKGKDAIRMSTLSSFTFEVGSDGRLARATWLTRDGWLLNEGYEGVGGRLDESGNITGPFPADETFIDGPSLFEGLHFGDDGNITGPHGSSLRIDERGSVLFDGDPTGIEVSMQSGAPLGATDRRNALFILVAGSFARAQTSLNDGQHVYFSLPTCTRPREGIGLGSPMTSGPPAKPPPRPPAECTLVAGKHTFALARAEAPSSNPGLGRGGGPMRWVCETDGNETHAFDHDPPTLHDAWKTCGFPFATLRGPEERLPAKKG
jgi:hypothetical protein